MGLRMKSLTLWGFTEKPSFWEGGSQKTNTKGRIAKRLKVLLNQEKRVGAFEGGWYHNAKYGQGCGMN